ncbi:MAG: hypothetical protein CL836_01770 [Crocinitomicaceae bacterium]|nr:hypothetical protein [Crocinitomicaceae bacterium]
MRTTLFTILIYVLLPLTINGQTKKISFSSKHSKGITQKNKSLLILWKKVVFKHHNSIMNCDSASYDRANNSFIAYKNIKINENDSLHLFGDSLHYYGNEQKAYLYGNVKLITNDIVLKSTSLIYDQTYNLAYYYDGGEIKHHSKNYTIKSKIGKFNTNNNTLYFKKNVALKHPDYQIISDTLIYQTDNEKTNIIGKTKIETKSSKIDCSKGWFDNVKQTSSLKGNVCIETNKYQFFADSVFYNEKIGEAFAKGDVKIIDDSSSSIIIGQHGYHNEIKDSVRVWESALMIQYDSIDTMSVYADQFIHVNDSLEIKTLCFNNVVIEGTQLNGDCDSIFINEKDSIMKCITAPIIWVDSNQITGEEIIFKTYKGIVYNMYIESDGMVITKKDSNHFDQIKGEQLKGYFKNNKLHQLNINENGEVIYYTQDEETNQIKESNEVSCEKMNIYVDENKIKQISFMSKPNGVTQPVELLDKEGNFLDGFKIHTKRSYQEKTAVPKGE